MTSTTSTFSFLPENSRIRIDHNDPVNRLDQNDSAIEIDHNDLKNLKKIADPQSESAAYSSDHDHAGDKSHDQKSRIQNAGSPQTHQEAPIEKNRTLSDSPKLQNAAPIDELCQKCGIDPVYDMSYGFNGFCRVCRYDLGYDF